MFDAKRAGCAVVVVDPLGEPPDRFRRLAVVVWLPPLFIAVAVLPASAPPGLMLRWWFIMMRFIMENSLALVQRGEGTFGTTRGALSDRTISSSCIQQPCSRKVVRRVSCWCGMQWILETVAAAASNQQTKTICVC